MFGRTKVSVYSTNDLGERDQAEEILRQNGIAYTVKMMDVHTFQPFKEALIGQTLAGQKPRYAWELMVSKEDASKAEALLTIKLKKAT